MFGLAPGCCDVRRRGVSPHAPGAEYTSVSCRAKQGRKAHRTRCSVTSIAMVPLTIAGTNAVPIPPLLPALESTPARCPFQRVAGAAKKLLKDLWYLSFYLSSLYDIRQHPFMRPVHRLPSRITSLTFVLILTYHSYIDYNTIRMKHSLFKNGHQHIT